MSSLLLAGAYAGLAAGAVLTFLSHVAPRFGAGNFIRDLDRPEAFGRALSRREAHVLGVLIHLLLAMMYGMVFAYAVTQGWASGFTIFPLMGFTVVQFFFAGAIVMPLEGHGWFGVKHDAWFPVDLLLTNIAWVLLYRWIIPVWTSV
jgi:hypothetical protein